MKVEHVTKIIRIAITKIGVSGVRYHKSTSTVTTPRTSTDNIGLTINSNNLKNNSIFDNNISDDGIFKLSKPFK